MAASIYRRLTGRARGLGGYSELWIAADHILLLRSAYFRQQYQRFALADIQAVVITEEPSRTPLQAALGATALLWTLCFTLVSSSFSKGFFLVSGGLALLWIILDLARGRRCRCHLHTAVSRELLAPVSRVRVANEFLRKLQPAIEAVQGAVPSERLPDLEERTSTFAGAANSLADQPPEIAHAPGYLAEIVFVVFLVNAALIFGSVLLKRASSEQLITNVLPTTLFSEAVIVIVSLVRRSVRDPRRFIYALMAVALVAIGWDLVIAARHFGAYMAAVMGAAQRDAPPPPITFSTIFDRTHAFIAAEWRAAAGVLGMALAFVERRQITPKPSATTRQETPKPTGAVIE